MGPVEKTQVTGRRCSSVTQIFPYASGFFGRLCTDSLASHSRPSLVEDKSVDVWEFDGDEKVDGEVSLLSLLALLVLLERRRRSGSDSDPDDWDSSPTAASAKQSKYMSLMCFLCWSIVF
jgi:hypothetical protein